MIDKSAIYLTVNDVRCPLTACSHLRLTINPVTADGNYSIYALQLNNAGTSAVSIGSVDFTFSATPFFQGAASNFRFYKEGLTAVGVAGSLSADDCDVKLDPGFLHLTVSDPTHYRSDQAGWINAEHMGILSRVDTGQSQLVGFVTANRFCCRVVLESNDDQCVAIKAVVDTDSLLIQPGETWHLETLMVARESNVELLLTTYADELGRRMQARVPKDIPSGWCSYYYYYGSETEEAILENARFLASHRGSYPVNTIQIDDGWQRARGDWLISHSTKFPNGMAWLAERIGALGLRPGLWVAPLLVAEGTPVYHDHPDWLLRDHQGELLTMEDNYFLDPTHPGALTWIAEIFANLHDWGYDYFKLDFLFVATCYGARYHDPTKARLEAYRQVLQVIRDAVGQEVYLLGGTAITAANVGLVDGCRIATDVTPFWAHSECIPESPAIINVCRNIINRGYQNGRLWCNDPDCLIVRGEHGRAKYAHMPSLTLSETQMLVSAIILSGGSMFLGDRLKTLPSQRLEIIRQALVLADKHSAVPLDRMERLVPRLWFRHGQGTQHKPHLLGMFNWNAESVASRIPLTRMGLDSSKNYQMAAIWPGQPPVADDGVTVSLPPHTCALIQIWH